MATIDVSTVPPLQRFSLLSAHAFGGTDPNPAPSSLRLLGQYLQSQSCNLSEVEVLRHWVQQESDGSATLNDSGVDLDAVERAVASRAAAVRTVLTQNKDKIALMTSTSSAAGHDKSRGGGTIPTDGNYGSTTSVVEWWHLGHGSPWDFAPIANDGADGLSTQSNYCFVCLRQVLDVVEPFLSAMRCTAALGAEDQVDTVYQEGSSYVTSLCAHGEPVSVFASLELARAYVALSFGGHAGIAGVARALQSSRALDEVRRLSSLLEQVEEKGADALDTQHPTLTTDHISGTLTKAQAYWSLAVLYSVFFHTVAAYLDGVSGKFEDFAVAVLGTGESFDLQLWGASRFPSIRFALPETSTEGRGGEANRNSSKAPVTVRTRMAALFPSSGSHVTGSGADYYLAEYKPLVANVLTPARTFSTLLLLSAVATLPLPVVLKRLPLWAELRELYEDCEDLKTLLRALHDGQLGKAWHSVTVAAARYLTNVPHIRAPVLQQLLEGVKKALCFHYLRTRDGASISRAAADLNFGSPGEFVDVVTTLIRDQYIDARIDLVNGTIHMAHTGLSIGDNASTEEAMARAVLGLSTLEMQLTCMSAERNLIFVPTSLDSCDM